MTALLFVRSPITSISAIGSVLTYHENLDLHGGYDTMDGIIGFANGMHLQWGVSIALPKHVSPYGRRDITYHFQFQTGCLAYAPFPISDRLKVGEEEILFEREPRPDGWSVYSQWLYHRMHADIADTITKGIKSLHNVRQGMNVTAACILAFQSAKADGAWQNIPEQFQRLE